MKRILITTIFCLIYSMLPSYGASDRLLPHFFEGRLSLSPVPLVGQRATMSLELTAVAGDCEGAIVQFRTPAGIALSGRSVFEDQYLTKGLPHRYFTDIEVLEEGSYALQATVYFHLSDGQRRAEHFFIYLSAGETNSQSGNSEIWNISSPLRPLAPSPHRSPAPAFDRQAAGGTVTVSGRITYYDDNLSQEVPIRSVAVELLEENRQGSQQIGNIYTDDDGFYSFENVRNVDPEDGTGRDIWLRISFENDVLKITDAGNTLYKFESLTTYNIPDGQINNDYSLDDRNQHRGLGHIFNCVMDAYDFLQKNVGWHRKKITVRWPYKDEEGAIYKYFYLPGGKLLEEYIHIPGGREWSRVTMIHEYGHAVMMALYGYNANNLPQDSFQGDHSVYTVSDLGLAMKEGWAEFFEALVDDSAYNVTAYTNVDTPNIESNNWWTGDIDGRGSNTRGEIVEGAVASILWDIADTDRSRDETPGVDDDEMDGMIDEVWALMSKYRPGSILEFWDRWVEDGYGQIRSLYSIYANHGVKATPPWDVNGDGFVDFLDVIIIGSYFGQKVSSSARPNPDVNRDGEVNILDLIMWASNTVP